MARGKRNRYFVHRNGFEDGTAYVLYQGTSSYLVVVERAERELRSDEQRVAAGLWSEITAGQAAEILKRKPGTCFIGRSAQPASADAVDPSAQHRERPQRATENLSSVAVAAPQEEP